MARKYTEEQHEWLLLHFPTMTNGELAQAFGERFGTSTTYEAMKSYGTNRHLRKDPGVISRALRHYTEDEDDFLREFIPGHGTREVSDAFEQRFGRRLTKGQVCHVAQRLGVRCGVNAGRFEKGTPSKNKGKSWDEMGLSEDAQKRIRANHFKRGERSKHTESRMRKLLDTKVNNDGTLMIYVRPRNAPWPARHWISYARFVWMQANGRDWPDGHRVMFADHDNRNFDPENIVPVPDELCIIIQGNAHGHALPYHDRETLEVAINHAKVIRARRAAEVRLRDGGTPHKTTSNKAKGEEARCRA